MGVDTDGDGEIQIQAWSRYGLQTASSYHPCGSYFTLSLAADTTVKSLTFDCSHVGLDKFLALYVTDLLGNQCMV